MSVYLWTSELILPWPARCLHPNARTHWAVKAKAAKAARHDAALIAKAANWHRCEWPDGKLHLWIDFYPPDHRRRDDDGLLTSVKPHRDGIADAIGIDDVRFVSHPYVHDETRKPGEVRIRMTRGPGA